MICEVEPEDDFHVRCKLCHTQYRIGVEVGNCSAQEEQIPVEQIPVEPKPVEVKQVEVKQVEIKQTVLEPDNIIKDITFCITSFERPHHLERLLVSIQKFFPNAKVLVADYSQVHPKITFGKMLELDFDAGISVARNVLAQACTTKYLLMLEEDFVFTQDTKLEPFLDVLTCDTDMQIAVVGGCIDMEGERHWYDLDLRKHRKILYGEKSNNPFTATKNGTYYKLCDMVFNYCLWRTQVLRDNPYPPELKIGEHVVCFYLLKERAQWRVAFTHQTSIYHDLTGRSSDYQSFRTRARALQTAWFNRRDINNYRQPQDGYGTYVPKYTNIVVMGVGHSGTSILSKMLMQCGYNKNDSDEEYGESVSVREVNDRMFTNSHTLHHMQTAMDNMLEPWVIKDPRFVYHLDKWATLFAKDPPLLVWIKRDTEAVRESYLRRYGKDNLVVKRLALAQDQYNRWPWHKITINYEDIAQAVQMFQFVRKPEIRQLELFK